MGFEWEWWQWILFFAGCFITCIMNSNSNDEKKIRGMV